MSESAPAKSRKPWALTFFGLLVISGLVAMPFLAGPPQADKMPDMVRFLGHFHPLILHLPIGVFTLILLQELGLIFFKKRGDARPVSLFPMFFGVASATLAVLAGFLLYQGGDFEGDLVERHMWGGLAFAVTACLTFIVQAWSIALAANLAFYRLLLFVSVGVMGFASHDGGSITHGTDYLIRYAPDPIRKFFNAKPRTPAAAPSEKPPLEQLVYADIVAPILERRCVQCHKEGNSKGRLRMDTYELLLKGGKEGPAIEPGSAADSNIVIRAELPLDDEEHMPPENKPQLEDHELLVIKWWLETGADPAKALAAYEVPSEVSAAISLLLPPGSGLDAGEEEDAVTSQDEGLANTVAELSKEFPGAVTFESRNSPLVTFTAVSMRGTLDDESFVKISPIVPQLVTIDLSATKITDAAIAQLEGAENLRLIRLAETAVTDAAIDTLITLPSLESINLYGTNVTDAGVMKLTALPNLKRLYLWQTEVSEAAINELREKMPDCEIVTGI